MLNSKQVDRLFLQNAALFGYEEGVPKYRAIELFGKEAVDYVFSTCNTRGNYNSYATRGPSAWYITHKGFQIAATYMNVQEVEMKEYIKANVKRFRCSIIKMRVKAYPS